MHSCVTSKNAKWCHLIWPTRYMVRVDRRYTQTDGRLYHSITALCRASRGEKKNRRIELINRFVNVNGIESQSTFLSESECCGHNDGVNLALIYCNIPAYCPGVQVFTRVRTCIPYWRALSGGRCRGSSATPFQFIFIIDCQPHQTSYCWWPSFPGRRCTCLEQSARSCHFRTFRSSLPVPA